MSSKHDIYLKEIFDVPYSHHYQSEWFKSWLKHQNIQLNSLKNDALIVNKGITDDIKKNPNNVIINLTRFKLPEDEAQVLNLGLKHGVLSRPKE